ncbi:hypothetical protein ACQ4PT_050012 [Festuca glaucescens]
MAGVASASAAPLPAAPASNPAARSPPSFLPLRARRLRSPVVLATGYPPRLDPPRHTSQSLRPPHVFRCSFRLFHSVCVLRTRGRPFRAEAIRTQREKAEQETEVSAVEESFPAREEASPPPEGAAADDPPAPTDDDDWAVRLEQSFNIFLTDSIIVILDALYRDRDYARFFVLETIARVPYFAFISVLHLYETFGWWRRADYIKVHFAESMNEFHHLLIMEELGGNSVWVDRFLARFSAFFYYFMTVAMYMLSPRMAYHFSECVERHAYSTYDKFLKLNGDEFQTSRVPCSRRPKVGIVLSPL